MVFVYIFSNYNRSHSLYLLQLETRQPIGSVDAPILYRWMTAFKGDSSEIIRLFMHPPLMRNDTTKNTSKITVLVTKSLALLLLSQVRKL